MDISALMEFLKAFLIGLVEGITEWLPISSTGHMILVDEFVRLNVSAEFLELFLVVIQIGAIMAVVILYFHKLNPFSSKKSAGEKKATWHLWAMVVIGCIPAAVFGLLLDDWVNEHLYNAWVVAIMLIVYGVIFIVMEALNRKKIREVSKASHCGDVDGALFKIKTVDEIDWKTALKIGFFQVLAIVPGTSRSGATIIGGMLCGCSRTAAAEFTFFLAIPVMLGWGIVKVVKYVLGAASSIVFTEVGVLVVGILTAFVVSILAIRFLMGYIKKNDFTAFGIYRIILGVCVIVYFLVAA